jgi:predicted transcriptional regulator
MGQTFTIRLTKDLADWLEETAKSTGMPAGRIVREQLERARAKSGKQRFLRLAGKIRGLPADLSTRKGYSRK